MHIKGVVVASALGIGCAGPVHAAPENITDGELALTPSYCQDVQGIKWGDQYYNPSPRAAYWVGMMGKTFWAMHHYCWAQIHIHRSRAAGLTRQQRDFMIDSAIGDYYYVVKNATPNFVLLPEIYLRIGEAQVMKNSPVAALEAFSKSRELKEDYWPPYVRAANVLDRLGKKPEALALIEDGVHRMPAEPALRTEFEKLGGNVARLGPLAAAQPASDPEAPASSAAP